jgi:sigma-E factor negative regulatory protein RseB
MQIIDDMILPEGFVVESASQRAMTLKQSPVRHIVLSDSIANVSIFISELEHEVNLKPMLMGRGAMNVYTRSNDRYKVTVLGEVPSKTVEMIGASVKL